MAKRRKRRSKAAGGVGREPGRGRAERWALGFLATSVVVVPMVFWPGLADEFRLPKLALAEALGLLSILALCMSPVAAARWRRALPVLFGTAPLVLLSMLSVLTGEHPAHGRVAVGSLLVGWLVLVAWSSQGLRVQRVLGWTVVPGVLIAILMLSQYLELWQPLAIEENRRRLQLTTSIGNVGEAAAYLLLPAVFCGVRALRSLGLAGTTRRTLWWISLTLVPAAAVVVSGTITAIGLLIPCGLVLVVGMPLPGKIRAAVFAAAVVAGGAVIFSPVGERFESKLEELGRGDLADATTGRTDGWKTAVRMLEKRPLVGVGFGAYGAEFTEVKEEMLDEGASFYRKHFGQSTFSNTHSEPLEVAAEVGWPGLAALVWACWMLGRGVRRHTFAPDTEDPDERRIRCVLALAVLVVILGQSLTYFPFRTPVLAYPFAVLLAALWGGAGQREAPSQPPKAARRLVVALVVMVLAHSLWSSTQRLRASATLRFAEGLGSTMVESGRIYPGPLRRTMPLLAEASEQAPWDERIPMARASYHLLLEEHDRAQTWYRRSMEVAVRPEVLFNMGKSLYQQGRGEESVPWFARAVRLDPLRRRALPAAVREPVARWIAQRSAEPES